jgi:hypothetical protein
VITGPAGQIPVRAGDKPGHDTEIVEQFLVAEP